MEYRLQSMYNHLVGRTASVISPFYSLLPGETGQKLMVNGRFLDENTRILLLNNRHMFEGTYRLEKQIFKFLQESILAKNIVSYRSMWVARKRKRLS